MGLTTKVTKGTKGTKRIYGKSKKDLTMKI